MPEGPAPRGRWCCTGGVLLSGVASIYVYTPGCGAALPPHLVQEGGARAQQSREAQSCT